MPQQPARRGAFGRGRQAVEACRRRAREHRLADSIEQSILEPFRVETEEQDARPRTAVGRLGGRQVAFDARFDFAPDDRGGKAGHALGRRARPFRRRGRDHHAGRPHVERLSERVDDRHAIPDDADRADAGLAAHEGEA